MSFPHVFPAAARLAAAGLVLICSAAAAHEYWLQPTSFEAAPGDVVGVRLMVGQMMSGAELPWLSNKISSFEIITPDRRIELEGMEGDMPAVSYAANEPGLHIIAHQTTPLTVTFDTIDEFREYLQYEGLGDVVARHRGRGLPEDSISESYTRSAKALVQVGPVRASDRDDEIGLPFELVALANPYSRIDVLPVRLTWHGRPEAAAQISVFRENGAVERTLVHTNEDGIAEVPIGKGGQFVLNSVHVEPVSGGEHVWASTWASLSFEAPAAP